MRIANSCRTVYERNDLSNKRTCKERKGPKKFVKISTCQLHNSVKRMYEGIHQDRTKHEYFTMHECQRFCVTAKVNIGSKEEIWYTGLKGVHITKILKIKLDPHSTISKSYNCLLNLRMSSNHLKFMLLVEL